jgi:hypothetical protein
MRIQPRQQLLEIWRATAGYSYRDKTWRWGGRRQANSISDAEQLLCIMFPATELPRFRLDKPDETDEEMIAALAGFGDAMDIPQLLVRVAIDYFTRYSRPDGTPIFSGGTFLYPSEEADEATEEQLGLDVVESFASSIALTLAALGFAKVFLPEVSRPDLQDEVKKLVELANRRLSAAMVGLLRSFTINDFDYTSDEGATLLRTVNQSGKPARRVAESLWLALRETAAGLRDLNIGIEQVEDLDRPGRLFECGWSWGITTGAPVIDFAVDAGEQRDGYALDAPYLYFTVVALDGIAELFSDRTRLLRLLDEDQNRLANALRLRWDLTQRYWATIAAFDERRWPLEDIPWRTVDRAESDYFSLLVTSIAARDLALRRDSDEDLSRLGRVLVELANRGRITRRPFENDPAVYMHLPGVSITLEGTENFGPQLRWVATDFAPLLLKRSVFIASLINDIELRRQLLELADDIWDHLAVRRLDDGDGKDLWDQPADVFRKFEERFDLPSWHHTIRMVESLTTVARMADSHPLRSSALAAFAYDLLAEAEHLYDQELLGGSPESGRAMRSRLETTRQRLRHCREIIDDRPGSAAAVLLNVLRDLDDLAAARQDVLGVS